MTSVPVVGTLAGGEAALMEVMMRPPVALRCPTCGLAFATVESPPPGGDVATVRAYVEQLRGLIVRHAQECTAGAELPGVRPQALCVN